MIRVAIADAALATRMRTALDDAIAAATPAPIAAPLELVHVTKANSRRLIELIEEARTAGAAGIQLVWDGKRRSLERHVFAAMEHARATPGKAPVILAPTETIAPALQTLVAHRSRRGS